MGSLKFAFLIKRGAGERAFAVTEEFAFDQLFRNGSAIQFDERTFLAEALRVNGMRHELFARAGLAIN